MTERERQQLAECDRLAREFDQAGDVGGVLFIGRQKQALLEAVRWREDKKRERKKVELERLRSLSLAAKEALTR